MANELLEKHMVRLESPSTGRRISLGYPTLKEAKNWAIALERAGCGILEILRVRLRTSNQPTSD